MSENLPASGSQFYLYTSDDGRVRLSVRFRDSTVWMPQRLIAELFDVSIKTANEHLVNIYEEGELDPEATIRKFRIVQKEGDRDVARLVDHYNLDTILAVGYRVRSSRGTQFRQWATSQLRELLVKGFVLDDEKLKEGPTGFGDYFDELLARIRDIRASERRFYQKITDLYATSIDYDRKAEITKSFYATVQNKLHWAIHGHTAAEIVQKRADAAKPNMGLTTWKNAPKGKIRKTDVSIAKNYLTEEELAALNRVVTMYLDYAEDQAQRRKPVHMAKWVRKLDDFLQFNERNILKHAGNVSHKFAEGHAFQEFEKYEAERRRIEATEPTSDFDQVLEETKRLEGERKAISTNIAPKTSTRKKLPGDA
jgi:hypothetical protein